MGGTGGPTVLRKLGFAKTKYKSRRLSGNSLNVISALGGQPGVVSAKKPQCSESGGIRCSQLVVACVLTADLPTSHAHLQSRLARLPPAYSRSWPAATCTPICCSSPLSLQSTSPCNLHYQLTLSFPTFPSLIALLRQR